MKITVINGPNLQLLGTREPAIYGYDTLLDIEVLLNKRAKELQGINLDFFQSNSEGEILDIISNQIRGGSDGLIINPAAYSHTSVAICDCISSVNVPAVEVHISNIHSREEFRQVSLTARVCCGIISGFGIKGYELALLALVDIINNNK